MSKHTYHRCRGFCWHWSTCRWHGGGPAAWYELQSMNEHTALSCSTHREISSIEWMDDKGLVANVDDATGKNGMWVLKILLLCIIQLLKLFWEHNRDNMGSEKKNHKYYGANRLQRKCMCHEAHSCIVSLVYNLAQFFVRRHFFYCRI